MYLGRMSGRFAARGFGVSETGDLANVAQCLVLGYGALL